jgi:hypothetical protein
MSRYIIAMVMATSMAFAGVSNPIVALQTISGQNDQHITAMALDRNGNVVVAGWTSASIDSMPQGGAAPAKHAGVDGFIACLSPDLKTVIAFTYVGGDSNDMVHDLAVAPSGELWVAGTTRSTDLPVTAQKGGRANAHGDGFVLRYSSDLKRVTGGRYLAGDQTDEALGIAVTAQNTAVVCGRTRSTTGLPDPGGHDRSANGGWDGFMTTIAANGADVEMFTFYGGSGDDALTTIATNAEGTIAAAGTTSSNDVETVPRKTLVWVDDGGGRGGGSWKEVGNNAFDVDFNGGSSDVVVVKLQGDGTLVFSTYVGGTGADTPSRAVLDAEGNVVICGSTTSADFPIPEAGTSVFGGISDAFLCSISADGLRQRFGRYIGGAADDAATDLSIDAQGRAFVIGTTSSDDLGSIGVGASVIASGGVDGFLCIVGSTDISFFTAFGWNRDDGPAALVRDAAGDCYIAGASTSDLPGHTVNGPVDAFIIKRVFGVLDLRGPSPTAAPLCTGTGVNLTWTTNDIPASATYTIEMSADQGETWTSLVAGTKSRSHAWTVPAAPPSGRVRLRAVSSHGHVSLIDGSYDISSAPSVTQHPSSGTFCPSSRIELAPVLQSALHASYQWRRNGQPINGATTASLVIASATEADAGAYDVIVTTPCGSVTSNVATIRVQAQPLITRQPVSVNVAEGAVVTLVVMAEGQDLQMQWMKDGVDIEGATSFNLILTNVGAEDQGDYACRVSSACGTTTSETARVTVGTTSVQSDIDLHSAAIYPQPASAMITVTRDDGSADEARVVIRDLSGTVVATNDMPSSVWSLTIPIQHLASGTYSVEIRSNTRTTSRAIMIAR